MRKSGRLTKYVERLEEDRVRRSVSRSERSGSSSKALSESVTISPPPSQVEVVLTPSPQLSPVPAAVSEDAKDSHYVEVFAALASMGDQIQRLTDKKTSTKVPSWNLDVVLRFLRSSRFEPPQLASFKDLTRKALFLMALASAKRVSELHALEGRLLPKDFTWSPNTETCFSYSLMGCMITSDPIKSLSNPEFLAERVAGNIRATPSNLSAYFKKNSVFPIHLLVGDLCLASASISLMKFQDFDSRVLSQVPLTLEGLHQMISVAPEPREFIPGKEPVIGVVFQLSGQSQRNLHYIPSVYSDSDGSSESEIDMYEYPVYPRRSHRSGKSKYHSRLDSPLVSSESSEEDILPAGKRRRGGTSRKLHHKKPTLSEVAALQELTSEGNKLRRHLVKAALEVESWKVDQQALFLKQWSLREAEFQRHLSDEWKARISYMESSLHSRLAQSDTLNRKLTAALSELSLREKKLSAKEERLGFAALQVSPINSPPTSVPITPVQVSHVSDPKTISMLESKMDKKFELSAKSVMDLGMSFRALVEK
ncbi:uncharacterized protein LOC135221576 [Macrobrachium nipponense]|uniref:uncharacterized protein LOC135221576 n=1 Tax=Macrobrachium nipponense TaxID=159736 RepID=UPI0030C83092